MYKLTLITLCIVMWQCAFTQNEQLIIEGSIVIADSESANPLAGTIRWTGQDFEGFDGTSWKSLTCGCDDEPDTDAILTCPSADFEIDNCNYTISWIHENPKSNTVNYDLIINRVVLGSPLVYPVNSYTINLCDVTGTSSGSGNFEIELLYWYDGEVTNQLSTDVCTVNYNFDDAEFCPDERYVTHSVLNTTESSIKIKVETAQNLPLRIAYYPTSNPSQIEYGLCEPTENYGANGNEHAQTINGLAASTEYTLIIQTSQEVSDNYADCPTMNWEDISCPIRVTTTTTNTGACMTYAEIRAAGRAENCYNRNPPYAHLAEFLYMNPTVSHWTNDPVNEMICAVAAPEPDASAIMAPAPSGGNDAPAIETFINANPGAEIVGTGTYQFGSTININVPVKIWDMPSKLIGSIGLTYRVTAPNVEMYRSLIDAQNLPSAHCGWRLEATADNFVLSTSGIENVWHKNNNNIDGILIVGASDFQITCNKFNNILGNFTGSPLIRAIRSATYLNILPSPAGYIANNESENLQSGNGNAGGTGGGAAFFTIQGYTGSEGTVKILANRCVNAAKRLAKCQDPDVYVASNFWHWKDRQGPFGARKMLSVIDCQLDADRITTVNNRIKIEAEASYDALLSVTPQFNDYTYTDIYFDCNDIELIDAPPANHYALGVSFRNHDATSPDTRNQLVNCSVKDNVFRGPGGTNYVFNFSAGYIDDATGLGIDLSGNTVTTPVLISVFRGSSAPLP